MTDICYSFAEQIQKKLGNFIPETAIILGSGLGEFVNQINNPIIIKYSDIKDFPTSTIQGHKGQFVAGTINNKKVICMQGRIHLYEGYPAQMIAQIIRSLKLIGIKNLIVTNAAGSLDECMPAGSLMLIDDHINLSGQNPLIGANNDTFGERFPSMEEAYDKNLKEIALQTAQQLNINLYKGTYLMVSGPNFETPAEIRAFKILQANAVGMSTVPEVISAKHCKIKVLGLSVITNLGCGLQTTQLSHEETLSNAQLATQKLSALLNSIIERI